MAPQGEASAPSARSPDETPSGEGHTWGRSPAPSSQQRVRAQRLEQELSGPGRWG